VHADISQSGRSDKSVDDRVGKHVGIRIPLQSQRMVYLCAAYDQFATRNQPVSVESLPNSQRRLPLPLR
jgi:hypothetical protein